MEMRAIDASAQIRQQAQPQPTREEFLDFGVAFPFRTLPELVEQGFIAQIERANPNQDAKTTSHYAKVRSILRTRLQQPMYQLIVIQAIVLATLNTYLDADFKQDPESHWVWKANPTPPRNREPRARAVAFITYAVWFLCPEDIPLDDWTTLGQKAWGRKTMKEKIGMSLYPSNQLRRPINNEGKLINLHNRA